ncbi:hypothetical protein L3Q82_004905 [Scortum barcoo]|uniref:Uncharacterized protein n=1 Tax=Scortum barcoo TaxID=214431 RepID=A0ACB8VDZ0_9TELE|nr:hypothetical protein L3Q82_004905 [Scortum barcoo]
MFSLPPLSCRPRRMCCLQFEACGCARPMEQARSLQKCLLWRQPQTQVVDTGSKGCRHAEAVTEEGILSSGHAKGRYPSTASRSPTGQANCSLGTCCPGGKNSGLGGVRVEELLTSTGDIVGQWKEYFEDLLNPTDTPSTEEVSLRELSSRHVPPGGRPRTRWRDYVSRLAWERLGVLPGIAGGSVWANFVIIVFIIYDRRLHKPMYILICNLAVVDIIYTSSSSPTMIGVLVNGVNTISYWEFTSVVMTAAVFVPQHTDTNKAMYEKPHRPEAAFIVAVILTTPT